MYQATIREIAVRIGRFGYDAAQIEGWMRLEHPTLDALSLAEFAREVEIGCQCIDADPELSRRLPQTM